MSDWKLFDDAPVQWQSRPVGEPPRRVMPVPDPKTLVRRSDPETSKEGARKALYRAGTQKAKLLEAFVAAEGPITDAEAASAAGLLVPGACWWRRCSNLREDGMIRPVGQTLSPLTGEAAMACEPTQAGLDFVAGLQKS